MSRSSTGHSTPQYSTLDLIYVIRLEYCVSALQGVAEEHLGRTLVGGKRAGATEFRMVGRTHTKQTSPGYVYRSFTSSDLTTLRARLETDFERTKRSHIHVALSRKGNNE